MPKQISIHKMVDQVFEKGVEDIIDEVVEERNFIVNTITDWINDNEMWQELLDDKQNRKMFIQHLQELTLQEIQTNALIELATIKHGIE